MSRSFVLTGLLTSVALGLAGRGARAAGPQDVGGARVTSAAPATSVEPYRDILNAYCVGCHNQRATTPATQTGVVLDTVDLRAVDRQSELWERVLRKLHTRTMPPAGVRRPDEPTYDALTGWLERELDRAARQHPHPGRSVLHRLNRAEYGNAVRDLLALDVEVGSLLPADDSAYGFDNISDALGLSPALQERYLAAAETVSALAVGDPEAPIVTETYRVRQDLSQNHHLEGLPLGTVGGIRIAPTFPLDAEYEVHVRFFRTNFGNLRGLEHAHQVELALDGRRLMLASIGGDADLLAAFDRPTETADAIDARLTTRLRATAGPHVLTVAFVEDQPLVDTVRLQPFLRSSYDTLDWTGRPHLDRVTITGPLNPTGPGDTPSRRRIFSCHPANAAAESACAREILATLARRAYRRPLADADVQPLLALYSRFRQEGSFESGIEAALEFLLASPRFLFRAEQDPPGAGTSGVHPVSDLDLASRLSFFLWSSIPDDELLATAGAGRLKDAAVLERQVRRMLEDPKAEALVTNFAGQWLQLRNLRTFQPNSDDFPDFDDNLRQAFLREAELFFASIIREDRNVLDLLTADYTFVNERLARHYGIPGIYGSQFRRVIVPDARRGLLGKGAILAVTSHATRTSPVLRGKWVLENVLGTPPAPPPPNVPALKENEQGVKPKTMREQMAAHRANAVCASCHRVMDPIGFALENFDPVGAWRSREPGGPIDASGELADGSRVDGAVALREALTRHPEVFAQTLTEKLLTYALGRGLDDHDMPALRGIVGAAGRSGNRFSAIVLGIVKSVPFQMRMTAESTH